ncbi:uncharacterized protein LOC8261827 [Ricinus communis]|uniref:Uncharacterized protein n=1 Tax=Ricinus communis TaxID=3988 RepID=B9T7T6_RICCO|nr:uncharacterized protein LOC8261827 [Ricinus communis]EEF28080.1 conserved hypothetical protein [Ricinus communis]|eukprot:XP_002534305.1 uncharacterized protein LOC8261827 [Ricinus communis]
MAQFDRVRNGLIVVFLLIITMTNTSYARVLGGSFSSEIRSGGDLALPAHKVADEYRPLLLNLLPKGPLPPSGPSKRSNNFVN